MPGTSSDDQDVTVTAGGHTARTTLGKLPRDRGVREVLGGMIADSVGKGKGGGSGRGQQIVIVPDAFAYQPEAEGVARSLIGRFPERFGWLREHAIAYVEERKKPGTGSKCSAIATARVTPPMYLMMTGFRGIVVVNAMVWSVFEDNRREALLYHELSHFGQHPETMELMTVGHDLEVFVGEARHFGPWRYGISDLAEQLAMWNRDSGGAIAGPSDPQA